MFLCLAMCFSAYTSRLSCTKKFEEIFFFKKKFPKLFFVKSCGSLTYEFTGLLPAKTRTDRNGPANAQAPAMIQLLPRSNPEFTISYGFCIEMCGMFIFVAIA